MSKRSSILVVTALAGHAAAQPAPPAPPPTASPVAASPWGSSPHVIAYAPPHVSSGADRAHRGLTLEVGLGGGTTSVDESAAAGTFAIGWWITRDFALAFRATDVGAFGFVGGSLQYYGSERLWIGGGAGRLGEDGMDEFGGTAPIGSGPGGFLRAGYNLGQGGRHALSFSAELQVGAIEVNRVVGFLAIGYQLL